MRQYDRSNEFIRDAIIFLDFIIMNAILFVGFVFKGHFIINASNVHFRTVFFAANFGMLCAQSLFSTILHRRRLNVDKVLANTFRLAITQVVVTYVLLKFLQFYSVPFKWVVLYGVLLFLFLVISRLIERFLIKKMRRSGKNTHFVTLVGDDPVINMLYKELSTDASMGYKIRGYYADNKIDGAPEELKRLGSLQDMFKDMEKGEDGTLAHNHDIFCSLSHTLDDEIKQIMNFCDKHVIRFLYAPRMVGNFALNLKLERLGEIPLFTNHEEPLQQMGNRVIKRCFDIAFSSVAIICMLPFIPIIALIIKIQSPGSIFFKQERTGLDGKNFKMIKFRSMHVNKDADKVQATRNDPRKFKFGNFMRKSNIDELPQFFNVLMGDMSIVGPRPHMLKHTEIYSGLIDKYMVRHFAKPGITGWAQVTGFRGETSELWQMEERVKRDIWYVENWTFWLDLRIIYLTVKNMLTGKDDAAY